MSEALNAQAQHAVGVAEQNASAQQVGDATGPSHAIPPATDLASRVAALEANVGKLQTIVKSVSASHSFVNDSITMLRKRVLGHE